jgi:GDPmannose 4,6-dehydratase
VTDTAKRALVIGSTGQDGSYLSEFLLGKGYEVWGTTRVTANPNVANLKGCLGNPRFHLLRLDLLDAESIYGAIASAMPDEIYNLGAVTFVPASWQCPSLTMDVNAGGVVRLLEAVRRSKSPTKVYQASTTEMFGATRDWPQSELTPFRPISPYATAKCAAHWTAGAYRQQYGTFVCCGILGNHESPRRSLEFVTHKITDHAVRISLGLTKEPLELWTLDTIRDWGFAGDYVQAMWMMLQQPEADDYVIGTGIGHTVGDLAREAFAAVGLNWGDWVTVKPPGWFKLDEESIFVTDPSKAIRQFGWRATTDFDGLIHMMVDADLERLRGV